MSKKYISVFLVIMAILVVMTACDKKENIETTTNPDTEESQIIIDEESTEASSENDSVEDEKPSNQNTSDNTSKPSDTQSTKPSSDDPTTTKPTTTKPSTTAPTTKPTTTNKNESTCPKCGGIIVNGGQVVVGKYCDGNCDEWFG